MISGGGSASVTLSNQGLVPYSFGLFQGGGANNPGLNLAEMIAFEVFTTSVFDRVAFFVSTASGNVDVGIYDNTGAAGAPGARLTHSGSTACPVAGAAAVAIPPVTLLPGKYYAAFAFDNITVQVEFISGLQAQDASHIRYNQTPAFPLPATAAATLQAAAASWQVYPTHS